MAGLPLIGIGLGFYFRSELRRFLREVPAIRTTGDLERYKAVVARNMYAALVQILILGAPWVVFLYGAFIADVLSVIDTLYIAVPSIGVFVMGQYINQEETRMKTIPVIPELQAQRDAVVRSWGSKPTPDW
jgi:hypothetical protein